jgi:CubicO group peptidase (beta-lactamase class C family)
VSRSEWWIRRPVFESFKSRFPSFCLTLTALSAKRLKRVRLAAYLIIIVVGPSAISAQEVRPQISDLSAIRREVQSNVAAGRVPGISIGVTKNGRILWEEGFGLADLQKKTRATVNTRYYIASVTKTITATAIMQLQERGKLHLDSPVNDYLVSAKVDSPLWNPSEATIRRVLSHTAGLTTFARSCLAGESGCGIDEEIERYGIVFWHPGDRFDYSNLDYGVLGEVLERTSGQDLDSYLDNEIFDPLGMHDCGFALSLSASGTAATQYNEHTHQHSPVRVSGHPGASALRCSAHDLLLFGGFDLNNTPKTGRILSAVTIDEMHRAQVNTGDGLYGLGWWIKEQSGYRVLSAQGGTTDSYALLELVPSEGLAVVVVANSYADFVGGLGDKILSALIPKYGAKSGARAKDRMAGSNKPAALAGRWAGLVLTYKGSTPITLQINSDGLIRGQVGTEPMADLADASLEPSELYGRVIGDPTMADAPRDKYLLELDLFLRGDNLLGAATSRPLPGQDGDELPHWVKLTRAK